MRLAKVNVDNAQELAAAFRIEGIPAVKIFRDGKVVLEFVGLLSEAQLREVFDRLSPSEADELAKQANDKESGDPQEAESLYRRALEHDREHQAALVGLARVRMAQGQEAEAATLLERAIPGGEQVAEVSRLQGILTLREKVREFGDEATAQQRLANTPNDSEKHYEMGCVLAAAGKYREALDELLAAATADRKLAAAKVKEVMVQIFHVVGVRSELADEYRAKLSSVLY